MFLFEPGEWDRETECTILYWSDGHATQKGTNHEKSEWKKINETHTHTNTI